METRVNNNENKTYRASIGPSVTLKGEISGEEDILIEGFVEGTINLKKNSVTIASTGKVSAHVIGLIVHVEGEVIGDIDGTDKVIVYKSGKVIGNITAPRISIEEGAKVKGSVCTSDTAEETVTRPIERYRIADKTTTVAETDRDLTSKVNLKPIFLKGKEEGSTAL
jgi:cytoskeletal protein CcmA (bactofilin family)